MGLSMNTGGSRACAFGAEKKQQVEPVPVISIGQYLRGHPRNQRAERTGRGWKN